MIFRYIKDKFNVTEYKQLVTTVETSLFVGINANGFHGSTLPTILHPQELVLKYHSKINYIDCAMKNKYILVNHKHWPQQKCPILPIVMTDLHAMPPQSPVE